VKRLWRRGKKGRGEPGERKKGSVEATPVKKSGSSEGSGRGILRRKEGLEGRKMIVSIWTLALCKSDWGREGKVTNQPQKKRTGGGRLDQGDNLRA